MKHPAVYIMANRHNGTLYVGMDEAIACEKQIKTGSRKDKLALIERDNPHWTDLYETLNA
jgi:putative endonuclease